MCQDVAVIPFLWVLPLALYLLSFIICFDNPRWYVRFPFTIGLIAAAAGITWALFEGIDASVQTQVGVYSAGLFICCMMCHGELYRLRPEPRHLTSFYLMIAAGGAVGGIFVAVIAPMIFSDYYELHWSLFLCALLFVVVCLREGWKRSQSEARLAPAVPDTSAAEDSMLSVAPNSIRGPVMGRWNEWRWLACILPLAAMGILDWCGMYSKLHFNESATNLWKWMRSRSGAVSARDLMQMSIWLVAGLVTGTFLITRRLQAFRYWRQTTCLWLALGTAVLGAALWKQAGKSAADRVYTSRNFYGVFTIYEENRQSPQDHLFRLQHGRITHGLQLVDPDQAYLPTTYYGESSGIGLAVRALPAGSRRIGLVGLGTGTFSVYAREGDYLRVYEINPEAKHLATSRFTYITHCPAKVEVVMGDARLSMEREPPQQFDLLALDAFSGDAIPVHLLTKEAFEIYQRHLKPDGILVVHISNHYLDLEPVVVNLARRFNYKVAAIDHEEGEDETWDYSSTWILLSHNESIISSPSISSAAYSIKTNSARMPLWTDDFTAMFQILK
jgi:hypothetical protein